MSASKSKYFILIYTFIRNYWYEKLLIKKENYYFKNLAFFTKNVIEILLCF